MARMCLLSFTMMMLRIGAVLLEQVGNVSWWCVLLGAQGMPFSTSDTGLGVTSSSSSKGPSQCLNKLTASSSEDGDLPSRLPVRVQALQSNPSLIRAHHVPTPPSSFNVEDLCGHSDNGQSIDRTSWRNDSPTACEGETYSSQDSSQSLSTGLVCESQPTESTEKEKQPEDET